MMSGICFRIHGVGVDKTTQALSLGGDGVGVTALISLLL